MPRFVVLEHHHQGVHWDFMLDCGESLRTWRLSSLPQAGELAAELLPDHRRAYLDYEGEVSGERGRVVRWDRGDFDWVAQTPDCVIVDLRGGRLAGRAYLAKGESGSWTFKLTPLDPSRPAVAG
jgi:hypothetical protein